MFASERLPAQGDKYTVTHFVNRTEIEQFRLGAVDHEAYIKRILYMDIATALARLPTPLKVVLRWYVKDLDEGQSLSGATGREYTLTAEVSRAE